MQVEDKIIPLYETRTYDIFVFVEYRAVALMPDWSAAHKERDHWHSLTKISCTAFPEGHRLPTVCMSLSINTQSAYTASGTILLTPALRPYITHSDYPCAAYICGLSGGPDPTCSRIAHALGSGDAESQRETHDMRKTQRLPLPSGVLRAEHFSSHSRSMPQVLLHSSHPTSARFH